MRPGARAAEPLEIAFFGSSLVSAYWNGAATYYRGLIRALAERGHSVTFYEPDAFERQQHRDIDDPPWARVVVYPGDDERAARMALRSAAGVDLVVKASGVGVYDELLERGVLDLQSPRTLVAFWDVDAPATLSRVEGDPHDPFGRCIPRYDLVLTYGGGDPVVRRYESLGAARCSPIYNALDPQTHHPVARDPRFECDLAFLGNRLPDRESRVDAFFLEPARRLSDRRFLIGGSGWNQAELPANVRCLGHVPPGDHNALNCTARAVLNVSRDSMASNGFSPATRVFEAAGAGACLISDAWEGIADFLEPQREVLVAHSGADVADIVSALTPERAREIGHRARERVLREHTYAQRAEQFEAVLAEVRAGGPCGRPSRPARVREGAR